MAFTSPRKHQPINRRSIFDTATVRIAPLPAARTVNAILDYCEPLKAHRNTETRTRRPR